MALPDVTFRDDFKHPYLLALVRWCVSSFWTTATVILHRIITKPLPITAPKPQKPRPASSDHLHPEPKVECVVLHTPAEPAIDVIFVHGLYGSLSNTWRQGEWLDKYDKEPTKIPLRRPHSTTTCRCTTDKTKCSDNTDMDKTLKSEIQVAESETNIRKILPSENYLTTENFYNNPLLDVDINNYETQAQFVKDMFESEAREVKRSDCKCYEKCSGCGCNCDECYTPCWPRDWIRVDYPEARVLSINYTSDPYLWRPLWIRENKRLRLYDRAEQMTSQLLKLGVGERPIIWVGHSKGGLFIKQIYCEAYEAHKKISNRQEDTEDKQNTAQCNNDNMINHCIDKQTDRQNCDSDNCDNYDDKNYLSNLLDVVNNTNNIENNGEDEMSEVDNNEEVPSEDDEDKLVRRSSLWNNSVGFMFYSVPHRGSPLADIKTPITARSIELMEICKDCNLVLNLQDRWLEAVETSQPAVRSLVETCRTLMSVLYLRIVSVDSADPGIGTLYGVSVDHREICKPSSRKCLLYQELMTLMTSALNKYKLKK